jgi:hypothetical protein
VSQQTPLVCRTEHRRQLIRDASLNGVDYVDVHCKHLCVHFLTGIPPEFLPAPKKKHLTPEEKKRALRRIVIKGGRRISGITATHFDVDRASNRFEESCLGIDVDKEGDWSTYTLCFVELDEKGRPTDTPMRSLDPRYACLDFTFRTDCPAEVDCKVDDACPSDVKPSPAISYLAKDYATFRQLILDRLSLVMPDWRERHVPDIGIALVELLAYTADYLSYYQDAVGTEQYLDTARQRISVRRHARLIDYAMHDGCNARAFVHARVNPPQMKVGRGDLFFLTRPPGPAVAPVLNLGAFANLPPGSLVFEPLTGKQELTFYQAHNTIRIYTWGDAECCLPRGATRATLLDETEEHDQPDPELCEPPKPKKKPYKKSKYEQSQDDGHDDEDAHGDPQYEHQHEPGHVHYDGCGCPPPPPPQRPPRPLHLAIGDFLLFEELACAGTTISDFDGETPQPDVDRTHRHVVRLTRVTEGCDALLGNRVLEVEWSREDALPFTLCISAIGAAPDCDFVKNLAVARGNIVLADHGQTIPDEPLDPIEPQPADELCDGVDAPAEIANVPRRYRPVLKHAPLTFSEPLRANAPATLLVRQDPRAALPSIEVQSTLRDLAESWTPRADLLASGGDDAHFVAEVDDRGFAHLRFGDGDTGRALEVEMSLAARYRAGNGRAGLVGAEAIVHAVLRKGATGDIERVRNPLPATGAFEPESIAEVKTFAPSSIHGRLQRAVTADDYAILARSLRYPERDPRVQGSAGRLLWNGSWYEADVAIDPFATPALEPQLQQEITARLQPARRMGHDLYVGAAAAVPIRLELELCVELHFLRAHVVAAVREVLGNRTLRDGGPAFFHPDNLTFGAAVYASRIIAAVMLVEGVAKVCVVKLERLDQEGRGNPDLPNGLLKLRPNEIARLDADATFPENGILTFSEVRGGR